MQYPVFDLFEQVGTVLLEQEGLYYAYRAEIRSSRDGFLRLFCHTDLQRFRLGIFRESGGVLTCSGRISVRQMTLQSDWFFSLCEVPWRPVDEDCLPQTALQRETEMGREVLVPLMDMLQPELVPLFCFLFPKEVEKIPCLSVYLDKQGNPYFPD